MAKNAKREGVRAQILLHLRTRVESDYDLMEDFYREIADVYDEEESPLDEAAIRQGWTRIKTAMDRGDPVTAGQADRYVRPYGFSSIEDYAVKNGLMGIDREILAPIRKAFAEVEKETKEFLDQSAGRFGSKFYLGSVIELRRFNLAKTGLDHNGIKPHEVELKPMGDFDHPVELQDQSVEVDGSNWEKFCISEIAPPDVGDAKNDHVTLWLKKTDYLTIKQCEPSTFHDPTGASVLINGREVTNDLRKQNRHSFGNLNPKHHRIPYCLTMFFTILLNDGNVLLLRRHDDVAYDKDKMELSGGEQLKDLDMREPNPFSAWVRRGVLEEFFPTDGLAERMVKKIRTDFFGFERLFSIGYLVETSSYPLFAMCQAAVGEKGYLKLIDEALEASPNAEFDIEGTICILPVEGLRTLLEKGQVRGRRLFIHSHADKTTARFDLSPKGQQEEMIRLSPEDLHPTTPYRIALLLDALAL